MVLHKRVFLADDDDDDRLLFSDVLREIDSNINCDFAINGEQTLERLREAEQLPDVVFLDLNMPLMNGLECLRKMKNDIKLMSLPVVIFTTSQNPEDIEVTHRMGANVFLSKPANTEELKTKLERILNLNFHSNNPHMDVLFQYAV